MADIGHSTAVGFALNRLSRRTLGADKQHLATVGNHGLNKCTSLLVQRNCTFEVDDMDFVALPENERRHFGVPVPGLVPKMNSSFQHLAHRELRHC